MRKLRRSGFTLIEILVVLSIAAILTGITVGGFSSLRNSNRKTTCQTNLVQIYQACRLYSQDYSAYPYYKTGGDPTTSPNGGIGLWALYTHPDPAAANGLAAVPATPDQGTSPVATYLRNVTALHCPADQEQRGGDNSSVLYPGGVANDQVLNRDYNSYQIVDKDKNGADVDTYSSFRASQSKRQLTYFDNAIAADLNGRPPDDTTVITWCKFHRVSTGTPYDNVLFADGSVQWLPQKQTATDISANTNDCWAWERVPRDRTDSLKSASACQP